MYNIKNIFLHAGFTALLLCASIPAWGQYFHFSQNNITPLRSNPAYVAASDFEHVNAIFRNQSSSGDFNISSTAFSYHRPFKLPNTGRRWGGFGVTALDDRAGAGALLNKQNIGLTMGLNLPTGPDQALSFGLSALLKSTKFNLDDLITETQYVSGRGFIPTIANGEFLDDKARVNFGFNAGVHWQKINKNNQRIGYFGLGFFDINKPLEIPDDSTSVRLRSTVVAECGFRLFEKEGFSGNGEILFTNSAGSSSLSTGVIWKLELADKALKSFNSLAIITKYLVGSYGTIGVQIESPKFTWGLSYDLALGNVRAANTGAVEVSFGYKRFIDIEIVEKRAKRVKKRKVKKVKRPKVKKPKKKKVKKKKKKAKVKRVKTPKVKRPKERKVKTPKVKKPKVEKPKKVKKEKPQKEKKVKTPKAEKPAKVKAPKKVKTPKVPKVKKPAKVKVPKTKKEPRVKKQKKEPLPDTKAPPVKKTTEEKPIVTTPIAEPVKEEPIVDRPEEIVPEPEIVIPEEKEIIVEKKKELSITPGKIIHREVLVEKVNIAFEFDYNKVDLKAGVRAYLDDLIVILLQDAYLSVELIGHTDASGTAAYNQRLSVRRANAIRDYLVAKGVNGERLIAKGKGESEPLRENASAAENRRVEILIYKME